MINFIIGLAKRHRTSGNAGEMCKNVNFTCHKAQRQMKKLYANVKLLLRKFSKCSVGVKCLFLKRIVLTFIVPLCGLIVPKQHCKT